MMEHARWDEYLIAEHELIERCMAVLRENLEKLDDLSHDSLKMKRAIDFLLEFGDKIHNTKEEKFLFPLMQVRGVPVEGGPLGVMIMEHEAERNLLREMSMKVAGLAAASFEDVVDFKGDGLEYLTIRAEHIWKENDILYPMGRKILSDGDNESLLAEFVKINIETYGENAWQKFSQMATEVEKGGEGRKKLIESLSYEQLDAIMEAMPFEVTFVDAEDTVAYFNRLDKEKLFPRTRSVIGRRVEKCHPEKSVDVVGRIVGGFKDKTLDKAEFWIDFKGDKILIRYFPVYNDLGKYMGVLEVTQAIGELQKLTGQKRLLD
ncbi:MAG: PAS domain-containing protein [Proteobacteria bacterium]|nr:PAS domain-containing protein [Pseudomonadota bacterium]MBU1715371.1 PAS domain-containing protein [Pseudomonadota bacterium]